MRLEHNMGVERRLVMKLLVRVDVPWSRVELEMALPDVEPIVISDGLAGLAFEGVAALDGENVAVTPCTRHIDRMGLIYATARGL